MINPLIFVRRLIQREIDPLSRLRKTHWLGNSSTKYQYLYLIVCREREFSDDRLSIQLDELIIHGESFSVRLACRNL